jgi:hypothetical protein
VDGDIGNIAMNENLSRGQRDDLIGGNSTIRATNPEILWRLLLGELGEKIGVLIFNFIGPLNVSFKQV